MSVTNVRCIGEFQKEGSGDNVTYFVAVEGRCLSEMSLLGFFLFKCPSNGSYSSMISK